MGPKLLPPNEVNRIHRSPHLLTLPAGVRMLIYAHLFVNQTTQFLSPKEYSFILIAPQPDVRGYPRGLGPVPVDLGIAILSTCKQIYCEGTMLLYKYTIFSTSFWDIESVTTIDLPIPELPQRLRLDFIQTFETTILVMPSYLAEYYASFFKLARRVAGMTRLRVLRLAVAEYMSKTMADGHVQCRRIHGWPMELMVVIQCFAKSVRKGAHVHIMDSGECVVGVPGTLNVEKALVEMLIHGRAKRAWEQLQEEEAVERLCEAGYFDFDFQTALENLSRSASHV